MGKTGKWWRSLFGGKKEPKQLISATSVKENVPEESKKLPKEKRRWSFRRSVKDSAHEAAAAAFQASTEQRLSSIELYIPETEAEQSRHAIAVAAATAAAADAAVAAAQAAAVVVRLTTTGCSLDYRSISPATQERAAIRIQTAFRRYLAMKALRALKGLVKLQALVRGHMVRKQAAATLRCMQALLKVQARVRARRVRRSEEGQSLQKQLLERSQKERGIVRPPAKSKSSSTEMERRLDETAKIVEMDTGRPNPSPSKRNRHHMREDHHRASDRNTATSTFSFPGSYTQYISSVQPPFQRTSTTTTTTRRSPPQIEGNAPSPVLISPAQSDCVTAPAGISPRTFSGQFGHFEDTFSTAESSPQYYSATSKAADFQKGPFTLARPDFLESFLRDYSSFPNYMANTESSKAKARSQSAPKQRPDYAERFSSLSAKKRAAAIAGASMETRSTSGSVRMQRSSSHVGMGHHAELSRSVASLNDPDPADNFTFGADKTNFFEYYSSGR